MWSLCFVRHVRLFREWVSSWLHHPPSSQMLKGYHRRDRCEWSPDFLQTSIRAQWRRQAIYMAHGSLELCSLPLLGSNRLLAHCPIQPYLRPPGNIVHHLFLFRGGLLLARLCQYVVAHVGCEVLLGIRHRSEVSNMPHLCRRDRASWN